MSCRDKWFEWFDCMQRPCLPVCLPLREQEVTDRSCRYGRFRACLRHPAKRPKQACISSSSSSSSIHLPAFGDPPAAVGFLAPRGEDDGVCNMSGTRPFYTWLQYIDLNSPQGTLAKAQSRSLSPTTIRMVAAVEGCQDGCRSGCYFCCVSYIGTVCQKLLSCHYFKIF